MKFSLFNIKNNENNKIWNFIKNPKRADVPLA
jgi:hypothetical protein